MTTIDAMQAKGQVTPSFVNLTTNETLPWEQRHNTLSFTSAEAMAHAFGGDDSMIPKNIGIIYGAESGFDETFDRDQSWDKLTGSLKDKAKIQVCPFSYSPTYQRITEDETVKHAVTFHAHSETDSDFTDGSYIYQAVLLGAKKPDGSYSILARVDLQKSGSYVQKPANFEVALDWTVKFC